MENIDYAALVERLRDDKPGGEVEPIGRFIFNEHISGWQQAPEGSDGVLHYSAATVARLIAERDAALTQNANAEAILLEIKREIPRTMGDFNLKLLMEDIACALKALAATEPKDKP